MALGETITEEAAGSAEAATFPLRVATVDMGSNAIRFVAARFDSADNYQRLALERRAVRLGHSVYLSGRLDQAAMDGAVDALVDFRRQVDELEIAHLKAVATSAVRESRNADVLVERIRSAAGIDLEIIGGPEEARLVHLAVARRVPLGDGPWALVDLGGGSVEVSLVDEDGILWSESHTMGSVRLLEELTEAGTDPGRFRRLIEEYISVLKIPSAADYRDIRGYIATGGNIEALARLSGPADEEGVTTFSLDALRGVIEQLARLSYRERVDVLGLRDDRADVILPAALVYERLAELVGADEIVVPHVGIKEGVMYDIVDTVVRHTAHEDRRTRDVTAGAMALGRKYLFDEAHGRQVASLAVSLFDQLRPLHRLGADDRKILMTAGLLHDIGQFISYKGHHKHSLYLISNSELPNFSPREMQILANVARYHRKGLPADHHHAWISLGAADRDRVERMAALIRLADALDREHAQRVTGIDVRIGPKVVTLKLAGSREVLLEGWALKNKAQLFENLFRRRIQVEFE